MKSQCTKNEVPIKDFFSKCDTNFQSFHFRSPVLPTILFNLFHVTGLFLNPPENIILMLSVGIEREY